MIDAALITKTRSEAATKDAEVNRLMAAADTIATGWLDPNVRARGSLTTVSQDAAIEVIGRLRNLGYAAGFVINGDNNKFRFALDPKDAPTPEQVMANLFGP